MVDREKALDLLLRPRGEGYVREFDRDGEPFWTLFDDRGNELLASTNRSAAFFYAAEHELTVMMRN